MKEKKIKEKNKINFHLPNNKKVQKLKEQGITLIALVVTIILLLILAGVTISQIAGSNGLFQRTRQAVEKYKNAAEEEQIQIGMLEQYVSDFSVIGESEAEVSIKGLEATGNAKEKTITVKATVQGEPTGVEYKINSDENWTERQTEGTAKEGETEYTYTFNDLALGKGYYVRVKAYDKNEKYAEVTSDVITLNNIMTATESDVLSPKTFLTEDGTLKTGSMRNNNGMDATLGAGETKEIPAGYTSGGKITVKTLKEQTPGDATEGNILNGKKAWVEGKQLTGNMPNKSGQVVEAKTITKGGDYALLSIPENGYYTTDSKIKGLRSAIEGNKKFKLLFGETPGNGEKKSLEVDKDYDVLYIFCADTRTGAYDFTGVTINSWMSTYNKANGGTSGIAAVENVKKDTTITYVGYGGAGTGIAFFVEE